MTVMAKPFLQAAAWESARGLVTAALVDERMRPEVSVFLDDDTATCTYLIVDRKTSACAIIDSILNYDGASARISTHGVDKLVERILASELHIQWILETHVHADHMSAAGHLKNCLGGSIGIGCGITAVQSLVGSWFSRKDDRSQSSAFDAYFEDGVSLQIGTLQGYVLAVPGHTPACVAYIVGDCIFSGDTIFMPDYGSARCDFPGGDAGQLYDSVSRLLSMPSAARMFVGHGYKTEQRGAFAWETTIGQQRLANVHLKNGVGRGEFIKMRNARDKLLSIPKLLLPSIQVNIAGGQLPVQDSDGRRRLMIPLDTI